MTGKADRADAADDRGSAPQVVGDRADMRPGHVGLRREVTQDEWGGVGTANHGSALLVRPKQCRACCAARNVDRTCSGTFEGSADARLQRKSPSRSVVMTLSLVCVQACRESGVHPLITRIVMATLA